MSDVVLNLAGGQARVLRLDLNALSLWESQTGRRFLSPLAWDRLGAEELRTLLWCCAVQVDPGVSPHTIGAEISNDVVPQVLAAFEEWGILASPAQPAEPAAAEPSVVPHATLSDQDPSTPARDPEAVAMIAAMGARPRV